MFTLPDGDRSDWRDTGKEEGFRLGPLQPLRDLTYWQSRSSDRQRVQIGSLASHFTCLERQWAQVRREMGFRWRFAGVCITPWRRLSRPSVYGVDMVHILKAIRYNEHMAIFLEPDAYWASRDDTNVYLEPPKKASLTAIMFGLTLLTSLGGPESWSLLIIVARTILAEILSPSTWMFEFWYSKHPTSKVDTRWKVMISMSPCHATPPPSSNALYYPQDSRSD